MVKYTEAEEQARTKKGVDALVRALRANLDEPDALPLEDAVNHVSVCATLGDLRAVMSELKVLKDNEARREKASAKEAA